MNKLQIEVLKLKDLNSAEYNQGKNIVLDIFGGSGSTLVACERMGRTCYIAELDEYFCNVIIDRWELLTKQKAIKE